MIVSTPQIFDGACADAHRVALESCEPVFTPAAHHADDRGWSLMNLLRGVMSAEGQINYASQNPGVIKAWHRHELQTDFWVCLTGHVQAGVRRERDGRSWSIVIGEKRPGVLVIPPGLWHGAATIGPAPAGLMYYVTHAYDAGRPDEERRAFDSVPGFTWGPVHR